jgi:hypothetical protein
MASGVPDCAACFFRESLVRSGGIQAFLPLLAVTKTARAVSKVISLQKIYIGIFTCETAFMQCSEYCLTSCSVQSEMSWSFQL